MDTEGQNYQEQIEAHYPRYMAITNEVLCDARLKASEKILLMVINLYREYRPNYDEIWWFTGVGQKTAQRHLRNLEGLGYIQTVKNDGRGKTYRIARGW